MSNKYIPQNLTPLQAARLKRVKSLETSKGGYTNRSLRSLGVNTPPTSGWLLRFVLNGPDYEPVPEPEQLSLI